MRATKSTPIAMVGVGIPVELPPWLRAMTRAFKDTFGLKCDELNFAADQTGYGHADGFVRNVHYVYAGHGLE